MAITHTQDVGQYSGASSSVVVHLPSNTVATDTLLLAACLPVGASVVSVTDSTNNRWIQTGFSNYLTTVAPSVELWQARGIQGGNASVTAVFSTASVGVNVSEWGNVFFQSPLDTWSQMTGNSASVTPQTVSPRTTGDLIITVGQSAASVNGPTGGYTSLSIPGNTGFAAAYQILSGTQAPATFWGASGASPWATVEAAFLPSNSTTLGAATGANGLNPLLQFPETSVQIAATKDFQAPLKGTAIWTDVSSYVLSMDIGPIGRQHELDRVQACHTSVVFNGRDGSFNPWNSPPFSPGGPMTPMRITAAWNGQTWPISYTYIQAMSLAIQDVLNNTITLDSFDILQMLNLAYLSNNNYAQQVIADGGVNLGAYYRLGDAVGSYSVKDSSTNAATGSLIAGQGGDPAFGNAGPFLYDPNTALDVTNGTNLLNGGFQTIDNTTESPTVYNPLGGASSWTFETWAKWTSNTQAVPGAVTAFTADEIVGATGYIRYTQVNNPNPFYPAVGSTITGPGIAANTVVTAVNVSAGNVYVSISNPWTGGGGTGLAFTTTIGGTGSTLFSAASVPGVGFNAVDVRVGATTAASITSFNRVNVGTYNSVNGSYTAPVTAAGNINVLNGAWHHIVATYAASVTSIYVDGSFSASAGTGAGWSNPKTITIGCDAGPLNGWVGLMSDVALYSSVLSASQIQNHYNIGVFFQSQEFGASVGNSASGRFNKVLSVVGLNPAQILNVPYPFRTLLYSEFNNLTTTSALNYLQTQTETEPGLIYQSANGQILALSRQAQYLSSNSVNSQGTFADNNAASVTGFYDGPSFQIVQDDLDTWSKVQVQSGRSGAQLEEWGPVQSATMAAAASVTGSRTLQGLTSLQFQYDSDALATAQNYAAWYNKPIQRVTSITLGSRSGGGQNITQQLSRGLYDRVTTQYGGQTPGNPFKQDSLIEQITHHVDVSQPDWQTTWSLSPYEILLTPFIFGNNTQSQLAGAASVTGSGVNWVHHPAATNYLSGTVIWTVASGATTGTAYNASAIAVQNALGALVNGTTVSGGPLNSANTVITFGSSQATFSATFLPSQVLTL